jgi:hypothetical protein
MSSISYAEDVFLEFYDLVVSLKLRVQPQDFSALTSFYNIVSTNKQLTESQANFILKLFQKYKSPAESAKFFFNCPIEDLIWKKPFRTIDFTKRVFVEIDESGRPMVCMKFPYQLKKEFEEELPSKSHMDNSNFWDHEQKIRKLSLYDNNLIHIHEFVKKHGFEIDDTFLIALGEVEEIWQSSEDVMPCCDIIDSQVVLINAPEDAQAYFFDNLTGKQNSDLMLAKSMGYAYRGQPTNFLEKISSDNHNAFWVKENAQFLQLVKAVDGKVCIILDRASRSREWIKSFVDDADIAGINRNDIKVCFRLSKDEDQGFNQWIKDSDLGGKVEDGKIYIFNHKPAKWLFKDSNDVKILASNNLYPSTNTLAKDWFSSHPCMIYLGDIKPSEQRGQKIVEL